MGYESPLIHQGRHHTRLQELMQRPIEVFFSYAHEDELLMDEVRRQLVVFDRQGAAAPHP